jgi:hypothetical protein
MNRFGGCGEERGDETRFGRDLMVTNKKTNKQGVCHIVFLPLTLTSILRQKKNYGNSNYFTMPKYNLQQILYKKPKSFKIF